MCSSDLTQQGDDGEHGVAVHGGQRISEQPPDLTVEDGSAVKAQPLVEHPVVGKDAHKVDNCGTQGDVEHQIGNALILVAVAEALKISAKIIQLIQLLIKHFSYFNSLPGKCL